jgi:hypothetical protein
MARLEVVEQFLASPAWPSRSIAGTQTLPDP